MERLSDIAIEIIDDLHTERLDYTSEYLPLIEAANLLAAYENTGLDPESIDRMQDAFGRGLTLRTDARERLEIIKGISTDHLRALVAADLSIVAEYEELRRKLDAAEKALATLAPMTTQERITTCFGHPIGRVMELVEADKRWNLTIYPDPKYPAMHCDPVGPEGTPGALDNEWYKRAGELLEADRDGRCVVLPCQVGTTVYMPFCDEIVEKRIGQFHINGYTNPRIWADIDCDWATTQRVRWDLSFGKTVFLTREAAEAALKKVNS